MLFFKNISVIWYKSITPVFDHIGKILSVHTSLNRQSKHETIVTTECLTNIYTQYERLYFIQGNTYII